MTVPEHIPAFSKKKFVKREALDPRTYVVLGDNETALSVIDALRTTFTGRIILVPCNNGIGSFENMDIMKRYMGPLSKNQCFLVEDDYLDRANVDIIQGEVQQIDVNSKLMRIKGQRNLLKFDKVIVAWGANQKKLNQHYSNVHYIEDRFSHAKIHNELIRSKNVIILGDTIDAVHIGRERPRN